MKKLLLLSIFSINSALFAQTEDEYWNKWDSNYTMVNVTEVINKELNYADSVEKNPKITQYFVRFDKFRFSALYSRKSRKIDRNVIESMKRVFKIFIGDPTNLIKICKDEALFVVDGKEVWMPIQPNILKALNEETKDENKVVLYCSFFNEHTNEKKLYNTFFVSEFSIP